jgi:phage baseplate assembly protein W
MAIRIANQNPLDLNQRVAVGVSIPFNGGATNTGTPLYTGSGFNPSLTTGTSVFTSTYTTIDQVKSNMINFLLTNKGERVLNPGFGSNLQNQLFENITDEYLKGLEIKISNDLSSNFPAVKINGVSLIPIYDENVIQLSINYSYLGNTPENLQITL